VENPDTQPTRKGVRAFRNFNEPAVASAGEVRRDALARDRIEDFKIPKSAHSLSGGLS